MGQGPPASCSTLIDEPLRSLAVLGMLCRVTALVRGGLVFAGLIGIVIFVNGFIALAQ